MRVHSTTQLLQRTAGIGLVAALMLIGCRERETAVVGTADQPTATTTATSQTGAPTPAAPPPQQQAPPNMRIEVNLGERELYVYRDGQRVDTHPVAVGSEEWPTPTGEWTIGQVVWNPRWVPPPNEEWAKDEEVKEPGDPENPLGRVQLVYSPPNSIHGTNNADSIGKAVSYGSIRVTNQVAVDLARQVMEAGGAAKDESWYDRVRENRKERVDVPIPNPVPIRVVAGTS